MTKYEIEYEEAPSGNVTFYNYKEPLMKFDKGYGFIGALVFDSETDKVQCHLCGEWFLSLPPHLHREHNMTASAYKEEVGLFQTTALIGETVREKLIAKGLEKRLKNLRPGKKVSEETKNKIRNTLKKNGEKPEGLNLRGTCPAQLLDRLQKAYETHGENFSFREHVTFDYLLTKTFGSVKEACILAGVPYRKPGKNKNYEHVIKYTEEMAVNFVREFVVRFLRTPERKDFLTQGQRVLWDKFFAGKRKELKRIVHEAYNGLSEYRKPQEKMRYTKEVLLRFMRNFEKGNGRKPSTSDCKRGLLPPPQNYIYHFGNWKNALSLAFPNNETK